jgi:hypothetical protein
MTTAATDRFVIELWHGTQLVSYTTHDTVESAAEKLKTKCVNGHRYRLAAPDKTGAIPGDDVRYDRQCELLGIVNYYA